MCSLATGNAYIDSGAGNFALASDSLGTSCVVFYVGAFKLKAENMEDPEKI